MPPEMITIDCPAARIATIDTCFIRLVILPTVRKNGERIEQDEANQAGNERDPCQRVLLQPLHI